LLLCGRSAGWLQHHPTKGPKDWPKINTRSNADLTGRNGGTIPFCNDRRSGQLTHHKQEHWTVCVKRNTHVTATSVVQRACIRMFLRPGLVDSWVTPNLLGSRHTDKGRQRKPHQQWNAVYHCICQCTWHATLGRETVNSRLI